MKLLLPITMLFLGLPVFAQTRVVIDNTTDHEVDVRRVHRLTEEASLTPVIVNPQPSFTSGQRWNSNRSAGEGSPRFSSNRTMSSCRRWITSH